MKLENELKERFGYELYDSTGESNIFTLNEMGDTFIVDFYEKYDTDSVICSIDGEYLETVNFDHIEYLLCTTALDKYFNCPRAEIFDFNTCEHYTVPLFDYSPYETSLFDDDCKDDYRDRLHQYYKSITDTDEDALRLLMHHEVIQKLSRNEFYKKESVGVKVEPELVPGQLVFNFEF